MNMSLYECCKRTEARLARKEMMARGIVFRKEMKASQMKPIVLLLEIEAPDSAMFSQTYPKWLGEDLTRVEHNT
jgi:hypothetical protein